MHSDHDEQHMTEILMQGYGSWYNARLLRAIDSLLPYADGLNQTKLEQAFPEQVAAVRRWYNKPSE